MTPIISIVCVTYHQTGPLKVFVNSIITQTAGNWRLLVVHDGPDPEFTQLMAALSAGNEHRITSFCTMIRFNDYGHTLREQGLNVAEGDYVLITNGDNYYVPILIEAVTRSIVATDPDVVMFDMIHSHNNPGGRPLPPYSFFRTEYRRQHIDMGAAVVRRTLARKAGFHDKSYEGDATFFEDVKPANGGVLKIDKIPQVLLVHN